MHLFKTFNLLKCKEKDVEKVRSTPLEDLMMLASLAKLRKHSFHTAGVLQRCLNPLRGVQTALNGVNVRSEALSPAQ